MITKTTPAEAIENVTFGGSLAKELLQGATIIESKFNGLDWHVLIRRDKVHELTTGYRYAQYETLMRNINEPNFSLMISYNGNIKTVYNKFIADYHDCRRSLNNEIEKQGK